MRLAHLKTRYLPQTTLWLTRALISVVGALGPISTAFAIGNPERLRERVRVIMDLACDTMSHRFFGEDKVRMNGGIMGFQTKALRTLIAALALSAMLVMAVGCNAQQGSSAASGTAQSASGSASANVPTGDDYKKVLDPDGIVSTFIGEKFYDQKITDEQSALAAAKSVYDRIGADDTTDLEITAIRPTETGTTYYVFNQVAGDVLVHSASVKVIADADGSALGLVSAILPKVEIGKAEEWEISAAQAEEIVVKECADVGYANMKPVKGATEQMLIPLVNNTSRFQYAWVVYTSNYDADSEMAYLAHYVDGTGAYMYALPISEPHNADAQAGDKANFDFDHYEQSTWSGEVSLYDGTMKQIEVPVLVDTSTNTSILADAKRKILCADYADWTYQETLSPCTSSGVAFDNMELLAYDTFIKVWDFFDSIGWSGPDDEGTPSLLMMDCVNADGTPDDNTYYIGRKNGFQTFAFNRVAPDSENMDVVAHEFAHCITSTCLTGNVYSNDMGAINEGMSDVLGNLVEMLVEDNPESAWLMGNNANKQPYRSLKDPHAFRQPEFRWDTYYAPSVAVATGTNDYGGVHADSSLLSNVSYKLYQAGMEPADQVYFWMNVELAMTPRTDYPQLGQILPWCMEQTGYPQFVEAVTKAIDEAAYTTLEEPTSLPAGSGKVTIHYDVAGISDTGMARFTFTRLSDDEVVYTWPAIGTNIASCTLPAGDYRCSANLGSREAIDCKGYWYTETGWQEATDDEREGTVIHVEEGKTIELPVTGLPEKAEDAE